MLHPAGPSVLLAGVLCTDVTPQRSTAAAGATHDHAAACTRQQLPPGGPAAAQGEPCIAHGCRLGGETAVRLLVCIQWTDKQNVWTVADVDIHTLQEKLLGAYRGRVVANGHAKHAAGLQQPSGGLGVSSARIRT